MEKKELLEKYKLLEQEVSSLRRREGTKDVAAGGLQEVSESTPAPVASNSSKSSLKRGIEHVEDEDNELHTQAMVRSDIVTVMRPAVC